ECRIRHQFAGFGPGPFRCGDIALEVLGIPGESFAHRVPHDLIAEFLKRVPFRRMPRALDELDYADAPPAPEHPQRKPERGGRFALSSAGVDDEQTFLDRLAGDFGI